jgi:hypothetical protein
MEAKKESPLKTKLDNALKLDFEHDDGIWIKSGKTLRRLIGILGISLPIVLVLVSLTFFDLNSPLESISHYYYTRAGAVFTTILSLIAIFLMVYSGYKSIDFYISALAGICALCVVFFPTGSLGEVCCDASKAYAVTFISENSLRETFHLISAAIFISLLAYMSFFIFTKSDKPLHLMGKAKIKRNWIYRICGVLIVIALLVMLAGFNSLIPEELYFGNNLTFWMEALAVESFGIAWLIKGETFFQDSSTEEEI